MKNTSAKFYLMILLLFIGGASYSQTCPSGNLVLTSQSQVDSFPILYPNCNRILGDLDISGSVLKLDSLSQLDSIYGGIKVLSANGLKNFKGLNNVKYFGGSLSVFNNDSLINFEGLEGLRKLNYATISNNAGLKNFHGLDSASEVVSFYVINNNNLDSLVGLEGLENVWDLIQFIGNASLKSLAGLEDVVIESLHLVDCDSIWDLASLGNNIQITRSLSISGNDGLKNLHGLESFNSFPGSLQISGNAKITSLIELIGLSYIGESLNISGNASLLSLSGLDSLKKVRYGVGITDNDRLKDLAGLEKLDTIGMSFSIRKNDSIQNLNGLSNLKYVGGTLHVWQNKQIRNLEGLDNLKRTGGLIVRLNDKLNSIWALKELRWVSGEVRIAENDSLASLRGIDSADFSAASDLFIYDSPILKVCGVQSVCDYLASGKIAYILNNAPGCMDTVEVRNACASISIKENQLLGYETYPNPTNGKVEIQINSDFNPPYKLQVLNAGSQILKQKEEIYSQKIQLDLNSLSEGLYFLNLQDSNGMSKIQKLIIK